MRFMITATPAPDAKAPAADAPLDEALVAAYMKFNEDMHKAGVLIASEGLNPEGKGAQVVLRNGRRTVVDGPYAESKELVGGFYLVEVASREEAIAWALRCPVGLGHDGVLTIHPMTSLDDLPPRIREIILEAAPTWSESVLRQARRAAG